MDMKRRGVDLHIDRLVLRGLAPAGREGIGAALEEELNRLIQEQGLPPGLAGAGRVLELPGGSFTVQPGAKADQIGVQIARSLHQGWKGEG
jgi:hypothetical protein